MSTEKYWIIAASKDHALRGMREGIAQACHGKEAPLKRMKVNDWVIIYSSKEYFGDGRKYQKFTAIGQVKDEMVYQFEMSREFKPFRRNINYYACKETPVLPLLDSLEFTTDKKQWGYPFRYGFFEINGHDFNIISARMLQPGEV
ncbi:MAG TPA: EVE domain-containing protein [Chitinophagaceae bacterium]|nr:EVE domain-containing protein [Chitinophagaceae bacterium]